MNQSTAVSTDTRAAGKSPMQPGGDITAFVPRDSEQLMRLADVLSRSGDMVPKSYQGNPAAITAAIMRGMEVGLAPMQALSHIAVVNGRPVVWGDAIPALIQRAGHHLDVEYEGSGDALTAVATLTRGDTGRQVIRRFSLADAKRAALLGKQGPWQQYPQRMIAHRARTWAARDGAADALMGMQVAEEVSDYGPDRARDVTPKPPKGGAVYIDPDPEPETVIDEIVDAEAYSDDPAPTDDEMERAMAEARAESDRAAEGR